MAHVILMSLKILGIVLLVFLSVVIASIAAILFIPFRYEAKASFTGSLKDAEATARISWLRPLFSGDVRYDKGKVTFGIRVLFKKIDMGARTGKVAVGKKKKAKKSAAKVKSSFWQRLKNFKSKTGEVLRMTGSDAFKGAFKVLRKEIKKVLASLKPKEVAGSLRFGFDDPALTGKCLGAFALLYPVYGESLSLTPDFEKKVLDGDIHLKGSITGRRFAAAAFNIFRDKGVLGVYGMISKMRS